MHRLLVVPSLFVLASASACDLDGSLADETAPVSDVVDDEDDGPGDLSEPGGQDDDQEQPPSSAPYVADGCELIPSVPMMNLSAPDAVREGFDAVAAREGGICTMGPLSSSAHSECANPGDVVAGFNIVDSRGELGVYGSGWSGSPNGMSVGAADLGRRIIVTLESDRQRLGFKLHATNATVVNVRYFDDSGKLVADNDHRFGPSSANLRPIFSGLVCDRLIDSVVIEALNSDADVLLDDLVFD